MTPDPVYRGGTIGEPEYREVEEHGRKHLALMQRRFSVRHQPGYRRLVVSEPADTELVFAYEWVKPETTGSWWWEKV